MFLRKIGLKFLIPFFFVIFGFQNCGQFNGFELQSGTVFLGSLSPSDSFLVNGGVEYSKSKTMVLTVPPELGPEVQVSVGETCADAIPWISNSGQVSLDLGSAGDGPHPISLRARKAGILSPCYVSHVILDTLSPSVTLKPGLPSQISSASVSVDFTVSDASDKITSVQCQMDQNSWSECQSPYQVESIAMGSHAIRIKAVDAAGNVSQPASYAFSYGTPSSTPTPTPTPTATPSNPGPGTFPEIIKIMPLGDSLTVGNSTGGYRNYLYGHLKGAGYKFDFVGDYQRGTDTLPDKDHQGVGGYKINDVAANMEVYIDKHKPDIVLLGAGGNDISANYELDTAPLRLLTLARNIQKRSPKTYVIVQTRPPRSDSKNALVIKFNAEVMKIVNAETLVNPKIFLQDNYPLMTQADVSSDQVHPSDAGYKKLSYGWFSALKKILPAK